MKEVGYVRGGLGNDSKFVGDGLEIGLVPRQWCSDSSACQD